MKALFILAIAILYVVSAGAQTAAEYTTTCNTLARLTEDALQRNASNDVLVYLNAAAVIRRKLGDATGCEGQYFVKVAAANEQQLSTSTAVVSIEGIRPVKGWRHREIDQLLSAAETMTPSEALKTFSSSSTLKFDIDRMKLDIERLKAGRGTGAGAAAAR